MNWVAVLKVLTEWGQVFSIQNVFETDIYQGSDFRRQLDEDSRLVGKHRPLHDRTLPTAGGGLQILNWTVVGVITSLESK